MATVKSSRTRMLWTPRVRLASPRQSDSSIANCPGSSSIRAFWKRREIPPIRCLNACASYRYPQAILMSFIWCVAGLNGQVAAGVIERSQDGLTPHEQLNAIRAGFRIARSAGSCLAALEEAGLPAWRGEGTDLDEDDREWVASGLIARYSRSSRRLLSIRPTRPLYPEWQCGFCTRTPSRDG